MSPTTEARRRGGNRGAAMASAMVVGAVTCTGSNEEPSPCAHAGGGALKWSSAHTHRVQGGAASSPPARPLLPVGQWVARKSVGEGIGWVHWPIPASRALRRRGKRLRAVCVKKAGLRLARDQPVCPAGGLSFTLWAHARASSPGQCSCPPGAPSLTRRPSRAAGELAAPQACIVPLGVEGGKIQGPRRAPRRLRARGA